MKIKAIASKAPQIFITETASEKLKTYTDICSDEIGALCTAIKENNNYIIKDAYLFKQEVHSTTTEITPEGLSDFAQELLTTPEGIEIWNDVKCWYHSHVNMGTSPSGQDESQMKTFEDCGHDFFIRMIGNKKGDMNITLYDYTTGIAWEEMPYTLLYDPAKAEQINKLKFQINVLKTQMEDIIGQININKEAIEVEIKEKVKKKTYAHANTYTKYGNYGNIYNYSSMDDYDYTYLKKKETKSNQENYLNPIEVEINEAYKDGDYTFLEQVFILEEIREISKATHGRAKESIESILGSNLSNDAIFNITEMCQDYMEIMEEYEAIEKGGNV